MKWLSKEDCEDRAQGRRVCCLLLLPLARAPYFSFLAFSRLLSREVDFSCIGITCLRP